MQAYGQDKVLSISSSKHIYSIASLNSGSVSDIFLALASFCGFKLKPHYHHVYLLFLSSCQVNLFYISIITVSKIMLGRGNVRQLQVKNFYQVSRDKQTGVQRHARA